MNDIEEIEIGHFNVVGTDTTEEAIANEEAIEAAEQIVPTAYIAGPMTGYPDFNFPLFNKVALGLRRGGFNVLNPAENLDGDTTQTRELYMTMDVFHVLNSNMVVLLPGWQESRGATLEAYLASELGLPLFFYLSGDLVPNGVDPRVALRGYLSRVTKGGKRRLRGAPNTKMSPAVVPDDALAVV